MRAAGPGKQKQVPQSGSGCYAAITIVCWFGTVWVLSLVVQVGEFYESVGIDAVLLVQHAGLNPMVRSKAGLLLLLISNLLFAFLKTFSPSRSPFCLLCDCFAGQWRPATCGLPAPELAAHSGRSGGGGAHVRSFSRVMLSAC